MTTTIPYFASVENIPVLNAAAAFTPTTTSVFRDSRRTSPLVISDNISVIPWGAGNKMPYRILDLIEQDETLTTCLDTQSELCYGAGLRLCDQDAPQFVKEQIRDFLLSNDLPEYWLGIAKDFKTFGFAVSVLILSRDASRIISIHRKEACYCRFAPADAQGRIPTVHYADWRSTPTPQDIESIPILDPRSPWEDLLDRTGKPKARKFAVISRIPTTDSTYYPIPGYASLFRSKWYDIKQLIGTAKEAKLRNSAPIKYHIEISENFWRDIFQSEHITDIRLQRERMIEEKQKILDFLTGAENSGKVWFSKYYMTPDGKEQHDVLINRIENSKEGGDWQTDIQEAINMICFATRVHSNLVGSVPGKTQSNNSGSDKRELYTISQALQKPYHDILLRPIGLVIRFNEWSGVHPSVPFIQLTTLDEHKDAKTVSI